MVECDARAAALGVLSVRAFPPRRANDDPDVGSPERFVILFLILYTWFEHLLAPHPTPDTTFGKRRLMRATTPKVKRKDPFFEVLRRVTCNVSRAKYRRSRSALSSRARAR